MIQIGIGMVFGAVLFVIAFGFGAIVVLVEHLLNLSQWSKPNRG